MSLARLFAVECTRDLLNVEASGPLRLPHPFPAPMPAELVRSVIDQTTTEDSLVLDPMGGSGTVLRCARELGRDCVSFDIDPLSQLMLRTLACHSRVAEVLASGEEVVRLAEDALGHAEAIDAMIHDRFDQEGLNFLGYWFPKESSRALFALWVTIEHVQPGSIRDVLALAFSKLIITKTSGPSWAMDLSHSRPHKRTDLPTTDPVKSYMLRLRQVCRDLSPVIEQRPRCVLSTLGGDARSMPMADATVDLIVTSSPYATAIDYMRAHKFSLVWMGYSLSELRAIRRAMIGTERRLNRSTTGIPYLDSDLVEGSVQDKRSSALLRYFRDMHLFLSESHRVLKHGAGLVIVLGQSRMGKTIIDTPAIVSQLASDIGFQPLGTRTREIPLNRRALPFPPKGEDNPLGRRMREEVVIALTR